MIIREAVDKDIYQIVGVLKASLGEKDLPLSEEIWRYKHLQNPFGKSVVLVAEENKVIIGVRAFMKWEWHSTNQMYSCFRAVDTATHPAHQGKGIFKKLTLRAIDVCADLGGNFIFNTPNEQSRPGYLKMGWISAGKIDVGLKPGFHSFWKTGIPNPVRQKIINTSNEALNELCIIWNNDLKKDSRFFTPKSPEYLKWRYEQNPLIDYEIFSTSGLYIAGYLKKRKNIKELRISECIQIGNKERSLIKKVIKEWSIKYGVQVISFSPKIITSLFPSIKGSYGPILTVREIILNKNDRTKVGDIKNWAYSLGDLELF